MVGSGGGDGGFKLYGCCWLGVLEVTKVSDFRPGAIPFFDKGITKLIANRIKHALPSLRDNPLSFKAEVLVTIFFELKN
jgi:hypothetical protein